jgi:hypothetical protein
MPYSNFTLKQVQHDFQLQIVSTPFLLDIPEISPSQNLAAALAEGIPLAKILSTEKARSEFIIAPILLELRRLLDRQISLFSGEDFTIDASLGLNGICDFLISKSPSQFTIEAPAIVIIEAKKGELKAGWGQCIAEMVAAQKFNSSEGKPMQNIYGTVTSGTLWQFLKLTDTVVSIESTEYPLPPTEQILGILKWMIDH